MSIIFSSFIYLNYASLKSRVLLLLLFLGMAEKCKELGVSVMALLRSVRDEARGHVVREISNSTLSRIDELASLVERLTGQIKGDSVEIVGDMVETELANMDKAIEEAANRIAVSILFQEHFLQNFSKQNWYACSAQCRKDHINLI